MAKDKKVEQIIRDRDRAAQKRSGWLDTWEKIASVVLPNRMGFTTQQTEGAPRTEAKFDSTGMLAHRDLKTALSAMIMPRFEKWLFIRPNDERLRDDDDVLIWCEIVEAALWNAIYDPRAQFLRFSGEVDDDLIAFGQGHLYIAENSRRDGLLFRSWHLKDAVFCENADGEIDRIYLTRWFTAEQARQKFGEENLPKDVKDALQQQTGNAQSKKFEFIYAIYPNDGYHPGYASARVQSRLAFIECVVSPLKDDGPVAEGGYDDFPVPTPRWDTESEEYNARSPTMLALGDILSSQQIGKTILRAGHMAVEPPLAAPHNAVIDRVKLFPGGVTLYNADKLSNYGAKPAIFPLVDNFNLPYGRDIQKDVRDQIWLAFFRNVLHLPIDGPQMTAFEVAQRRQEFQRALGPVFGRIEGDYPAKIAMRVFNILRTNRALPPPPEQLMGAGIRFDFLSPIFKVLEQMKLDAARAWFADIGPLAETRPHMLDHIDEDAYTRDAAEIRGVPMTWLRPKDDIKTIRDRRAKMQEMAEAKENMAAAAETGVNTAKIIDLNATADQKRNSPTARAA